MIDEKTHIRQYISDYFLENETAEDQPALEKWLEESEQNRIEFAEYKRIWKNTRNVFLMKQYDANGAWEKVNETNRHKIELRKRISHILYLTSGVAASILLFFAISIFQSSESLLADRVCMETRFGSRSQIILPDGSSVELNAGSQISYHFNREKNVREIDFQGEGFFNVSKNEVPFVITTSEGMQVKVLGTTFNLSAYKEDKVIQTTLIEGKVELNKSGEKIVMAAGDVVTYDKSTGIMSLSNKDIMRTYGWLSGKLYMDNMPLSEVCKHLERRYDVRISLHDGVGDKILYNGVLQEESITDVLNALQILSRIKYTIKGKDISISSK